MPYVLSVIMALSILLPALTGVSRFKVLQLDDKLFIGIIWLGSINELLSLMMIRVEGTNAVTFNLYVLLECLLLTLLFFRWHGRRGALRTGVIFASLVLVWLTDNVYNNNISNFYGFFSVYYSLIMMYYSIRHISYVVAFEAEDLLRNGRFIAATTLLVYFSIKAFTDTFFIMDLGISTALAQKILFVSLAINTVCNLLYVYAIICMRGKTEYTLGSW